MMGITTANLDPPQAIVVGTDQARRESVFAALTAAGYTVTALTPDDDLAASAVAQAADLAVFEREGGGNTAILTRFRRLRQRPSLAIIEPEGVVLAAGFGSLARGPHNLDVLTALLREYLGLETKAVLPETAPLETTLRETPREAPPLPEKPDTPLPDPLNDLSVGTSGGVSTTAFRPVRRMPVEPEKSTPLPPLPFITSSPLPPPRPREDRILVFVAVVAILAVIVVGGFAMIRSLRPVSGTNPSAVAIEVTSIPASPTTSIPASPTTSVPASPTTTSAPASPTTTSAPASPTTSVPASPIPATAIAMPVSNLDIQIIVPRTLQAGAVVNVQVHVRNVSGKAIPETFWVDLYVSPTRTPTPLVPWSDIAMYGATWQVAGLGPGESRDLYSLDADPTRSNLLSLDTPGTYQFYALADTFNELPTELSSGQARPIYLGGPAEVVVGNASTQP